MIEYLKNKIVNNSKLLFRTFWLNDFFGNIASSWTSCTLFLTITAGFIAGSAGLASQITSLSFVPTLLSIVSPYLFSFTLFLGVCSYVYSLYSTYQTHVAETENYIYEALLPVIKRQELNPSKTTPGKDVQALIDKIETHINKGYVYDSANMLYRSLQRVRAYIKIQTTVRLLRNKSTPDTAALPILRGCVAYQQQEALKEHKQHSFFSSYFTVLTESGFSKACAKVLDGEFNNDSAQKICIEKYLAFTKNKDYKPFYKNTNTLEEKQGQLDNFKPTGTMYSP